MKTFLALIASAGLAFAGLDPCSNCGSGGGGGSGDALTTNPLSQFAATTSSQFKGVISDENAPDGASSKVIMALGSLSIASGKTATFDHTSTFTTTDGQTYTFPTTSATVARTDAANTFTGTQTVGALVATTVNGNTITTGTGTLTLGAGKTTTFDHTSTFTTTDAQTYTFPTTSATLARTDAANTFTGHQTIEGVATAGATGTGNLVFATSPTLTTPVLGVATATSINGNAITTGTGTLTLGAGKTTTFDHTSTFTTTDAQTYTFPTTSATLARTDAANTFTGHQTIEGVATAGATGTGNLVFATTPTLTTAVLGSSTATTQSASDNSTKVATTAYVDNQATLAGGTVSGRTLKIYNALGSTTKAETMGMEPSMVTGGNGLNSGYGYFQAVWLPTAATVTGIRWFQTTAGNYTGDSSNQVGLYTWAAGVLTRVAVSTDDATIWKATANTWSSKAFSGTYSAAAGLFYIAILYHSSAQSTQPAIGAMSTSGNAALSTMDFSNSSATFGYEQPITSLGTSYTMGTGSWSTGINNFYLALY